MKSLPEGLSTVPCKGCGKPIVWGLTPEGKRIPLDPRAPVYDYATTPAMDGASAFRNRVAMVTHFATCPKASEFSQSKKD